MELAKVEKKLNYVFRDKRLLKRALTLASYSTDNNQTLEFFGDAILEFLVSEKIYDENKSEGELTELRKDIVSDVALTPVSKSLGLDECLLRGANDTHNKKAVPSAYEAVVAAIYLDGGIESARKFVYSTLNFNPEKENINYKGELQERLQDFGRECPTYELCGKGTAQKPYFTVKVEVDGKIFEGSAGNKKLAEQNAAKEALNYLNSKN